MTKQRRCKDCKNKGTNCVLDCNYILRRNYARKWWKLGRPK